MIAAAALLFAATPTKAQDEPTFLAGDGKVFLRHVFDVAVDHPGNGAFEQVDCTEADSLLAYWCSTGGHDTAIFGSRFAEIAGDC